MVLTEPTCTEEGIRLRECDCGAEEREGIPAAGHTWDEGTVTAEATAEQDGEMTFTCTVCGETRTEAIPAGEIPVEPTEDPASSEPGDSRVPTEESEAPGRQPSEPDSGFPWWILAAAVIAIGIAAAIFIISRKKK